MIVRSLCCFLYLLVPIETQFHRYSPNADFYVSSNPNLFDAYYAVPPRVDQRVRLYGNGPSGRNFAEEASDWTPWTEWSFCSRTCGGGVAMRSRVCASRRTHGVTRNCAGKDTQHKICRAEPCLGAEPEDFRSTQCSQFDKKLIFGSLKFEWTPYYGKEVEQCTLNCMAVEYNFYKSFGPVQDGTKCSRQQHDVCVDGTCLKVGCDDILGSNLTEDTCGICGGDNGTCFHYFNIYDQLDRDTAPLFGYNEVAVIPAGATHIKVKDQTSNYLALMEVNGPSAAYVVNGNWVVSWPGDFMIAGTVFQYDRVAKEEVLMAAGPTTMDLHIMLLYLGDPAKVEYEYWISKSDRLGRLSEFQLGQQMIRTSNFDDYYDNFDQDSKAADPTTTSTTTTTTTTTTATTTTTTLATTTTTTTTPPTTTQKSRKFIKTRRSRPAYCSPCRKKKYSRNNHYCQSDFVIHARVSSKRKMEGRRYRHDITIFSVYKSEFKLTKREYLWVYSDCCPKLRPYREYLLMGRKRNVEIGPDGKGSWQTSGKNANTRRGNTKRYETRLVVDHMDFWHIWKNKYERGMNKMANKVKCQRSNMSRPPLSLRDPETKSQSKRSHKRIRHKL